MIFFDFSFNSSDPLHWAALVLLVVFPVLVGLLLWKNDTLARSRRWLRFGLNLILWLILCGYLLQPAWTTTIASRRALLVGEKVPTAVARRWQDSLGIEARFGAAAFLKKKLTTQFDSIVLLGQDFPPTLLSQVMGSALDWKPYFPQNQIQNLHWQGVLRQGEVQRVAGVLESSEKQWVKVRYGGQTLDSTQVAAGQSSFALSFPTFTEGRTTTTLFIADDFQDSLRFYVRSLPTSTYQFILDSPDFESRTLADWLGRQGNALTVSTTVSKGIRQSTTLNGGLEKGKLPDIVITDPSHAADASVKKVLNAGKSVLFINLTRADANLATINRALGTGFATRKIGAEPLQIEPNLTAVPFRFGESLPQLLVPGYPVAVWNKSGKVGVSLLNETFPLKLSGDSVAYAKVWNAILAQVQPPADYTLTANAPLFEGLPGVLSVNQVPGPPRQLTVGRDTVLLQPSPLNAYVAGVDYRFGQAGWLALGDSAEVFVEDSASTLLPARRMNDYVLAQRAARYSTTGTKQKPQRQRQVDDWVWLALFVASCAALWIEPKL